MNETTQLDRTDGLKKIYDLIKSIHITTLTTLNGDGSLDSRPMGSHLDTPFTGTIWFLTRDNTGKLGEIKNDSHVSLSYVDTSHENFVTLKGRASVSKDKDKIKDLWNPIYRAWFKGGVDDPAIAVLRVDVTDGHYWEGKGGKLVWMFRYAAAAVTGGKIETGENGEINL
jgi:general stress protein 26